MSNLFNFQEPPLVNQVIRALWWNQPYANLMLHGKIETRTYPTKVRGKVLICSCKKPYTEQQIISISGDEQYSRMKEILREGIDGVLGQAIAIADLVDCRLMTPDDEDATFVEYWHPNADTGIGKRYCWVFENVKPIEPFEIKGKQGWAILDAETKAKINYL